MNKSGVINLEEIKTLYQQYEELGNRLRTLSIPQITPLLSESIPEKDIKVNHVMNQLLNHSNYSKNETSSNIMNQNKPLSKPISKTISKPISKPIKSKNLKSESKNPKIKMKAKSSKRQTMKAKSQKMKAKSSKRKTKSKSAKPTNKRKTTSKPAIKYNKKKTSKASVVFKHPSNPTYSEFLKQLRKAKPMTETTNNNTEEPTNASGKSYNWNGERWVLS